MKVQSSEFRVQSPRSEVQGSKFIHLFLLGLLLTPTARSEDKPASYYRDLVPIFKRSCTGCHHPGKLKGDLDLTLYSSVSSVAKDHLRWELVLERLKAGDMPPKSAKLRPSAEVRQEVVAWIEAVRKHGNPDVPLPPGPPFFRFSDASECDDVLKVAGFRNVDVRKVPQVWRFSASGLLFEAFLTGTVRTQALLHAQSAPALAAIRDAVGRVAGEYENHGTVEIPMPAVLAAGTKP